jgi:hypothetical protein
MFALGRTVAQGAGHVAPTPTQADRPFAGLQTLRGKRPCSSAAEPPLENGNTSQFRSIIANDHLGPGALAGEPIKISPPTQIDGPARDGKAKAAPVQLPEPASVSSTRRFSARPADVSFEATGSASPNPCADTKPGLTPCEVMKFITLSAPLL